jgi:hypothetical protein
MVNLCDVSLLISADRYVAQREQYDYNSPDCRFSISQTNDLVNVGEFKGIFAKEIPRQYETGINIRRFEDAVQEVFKDCYEAYHNNIFTDVHAENLKQISAAIVHWKMSSQGGRAKIKAANLLNKWNDTTVKQLMNAYKSRDMSLFRIGGVRIPTATAFMRFLYPDEYGIMDSRVVGTYTQPNGITTLSVREDGYINDTKQNIQKYEQEYIDFLRKEAIRLNNLNIKYEDIDSNGMRIISAFRPCDVEMALF